MADKQQAGKSLYHYQDFKHHSEVDVDRLTDILRNHRIYCSNPATFNDPWDCKPYFDPDLMDDPVRRAATAEQFIRSGPGDRGVDYRLRNDQDFLKSFVKDFSVKFTKYAPTRWGVYCLTPDPHCTLMWSHYSRNHIGIRLEFGTEQSKFGAAQKVRYQKDYPALSLHEPDLDMLLIKSDVWEYEEESRLICTRAPNLTTNLLVMEGDYLSIDAHDLKSIIVGCQADDETIRAIRALVAEHAPSVRVRQAVRAPNKYTLVIED